MNMPTVPSSPHDPDFYWKFVLSLEDSRDHELAMLGATLTPPPKGQTIAQALDQAVLMREEAAAARARRREALIKAAPWQALNHARVWRLEEAPEFKDHPAYQQLDDAMKQKLHETYGEDEERKAAEGRERIVRAMEKCQNRAGRPAPALPATAREVVLWAAGAQPKHWPAVENAFLDFLTVYHCKTNYSLNDQRANAAHRAKQREDILKVHGSVEALPEEWRSRLAAYADEAADVDFCDNFRPGMAPSSRTRQAVETSYHQHHQTYDLDASVHELAVNFAPLWEEHQEFYLQPLKEKEAISAQKSLAGKRGHAAKGRSQWETRTQAFLAHATEIKAPLRQALEKYSPRNENKDIKAKTQHFLSTLLTAAQHGWEAWEIVQLLKGDDGLNKQQAKLLRGDDRAIPLNERVNDADEETVKLCLGLIRSHQKH